MQFNTFLPVCLSVHVFLDSVYLCISRFQLVNEFISQYLHTLGNLLTN